MSKTASLEGCIERADELAQEVVNAWGIHASAGNASRLTADFQSLFDKACEYRTAKDIANNHRDFGVLSEAEACREKAARESFARAFKKYSEKLAACQQQP